MNTTMKQIKQTEMGQLKNEVNTERKLGGTVTQNPKKNTPSFLTFLEGSKV